MVKQADKKAEAGRGITATVKSVYVVNKPLNSYSTSDTLNIGGESGEFTKDVFTRSLSRASRRVSEPESEKK